MKVKCILKAPRGYLTNGKIYDVVSKEGDESKVFNGCRITDPMGFEIMTDDGYYSYCLLEDCSHADWEVVE